MREQTLILNSIPVDELTGSIATPIYQTSTFVQDAPGVHKGYDYSRSNNPTRKVLEDCIAALENGHGGFAFASGLAAIDSVIKLLEAGDEVIAVDDIYGGAFRLFTHVYQKFGIKINYVDSTNAQNVADAVTDKTKLIWIESPTNPTLKVSDIRTIAKTAKENNILLCVDNTFASPVSQKPIDLGADIVIHSATKYIAGHSDLIAGLVVTSTQELSEKIKFIQNASGAILGPFDSWLVIRGIETLTLRVKQHAENAQKIAEFLQEEKLIKNVYYPGLKTHHNHEIAKSQQKYFGGVIAFDLVIDDKELASQIVSSTKLFKLAESLGGIKSLCCLPCEMTHKSIPAEKRYSSGVTDSLIRLSVGLEDADDLIDDLKQAIATAVKANADKTSVTA
ncbi:aminotransferase class I/II-fold pyridoxal phosphate-dependent enzyme [Flavobacterium rakeshii]|uniref:Aminotransferase class I/II-fold pyridoxal phosphate-dependent enzyme n=1 Tax=Flavobacterium rakeshii TaxID=1038845 RepID=A0A6N8HBM6_9FLAO|nr:PLP-dependent aspartate aminotransferase family protein [Flavobacterium rakeshii]MEE1898409.1 PLP-dependent aspartate aminotransferase family protein [Flavobacterium rakeshii]MUV02965.1 aminotransferase class I/II-fold pyridoxal phosphate-dependent enzyme [Flavobacterium rakeshii]